ncbi:MAG: hypothetical protein K2G83_05740 [Ruminococcus sp.]|nr:hypothetical protein [Ruminococcus sp.]
MPVHSYKESGTWTAVYDSKTVNTVWKNIYWNGKLYDDGKITVRACAGNDENAFGDWIDITNHADIENLSGRYIKLSVEMNVSSTGKTPELFDITLLSDGADKVNYVNNAPQTKIIGSDTTCVSKRLFLSSETMDDAFCNQLNFKWSCNNENVIISSPNKPYTSFEFNESGEYEVTIIVSDGNSETIVSQMITVLNDEVMVIPIVDLEIPSIVKAGSTVNGKVNSLNSSQISEYEIKVGNDSVSADEDGNFTFTAPENDCIISINVKAINALGLYGESSKAIVIDGTAPSVELKSDSDEIHTNDTVTISALMSDENGINDYSLTLNGEEVTLNENYQYIFAPENAGEHVFTLTVEDIVGNISDTTLVLNVSEKEIKDTNQPVVEYSVPKMLMVGESGEFKFIASDDTGIAEFTVAVNGSVITLDENDCFSFISEETGNLIIDVHATDEACNNTDFQLIVPVISFDLVTEKTTYKENELVNVQLVYSDNLNIINQQVTIDGVQMTVENDKISVEGLSVGTHQLVWQIQDECGAVFTGILEINIVDSTAPEISVTLSNNNPKERDTVTAEITAKDEHGVASITANLDGKEISVIDNKAVLENLTAGKHTFKVTATDTSGNYAVYTCNFTVLSSQPIDTIAPDLDIAVELTEDKKIEIIAVAVDNSGTATITGTVNGEEVIFENHVAIYTPNEIGDYVIIVRAEDESGNYTEKTQTITITEKDLVFELKLGVNVEKNIIKPNEKTNLVVSTSSMLGEVSLSCTSDGGTVTENENGFSFSSDKTGTFEVVVTATDKIGNTASKVVYITVTEDEPDIDDEEYVNNINIEPRARVVLESSERTETKMTEEMAEVADQLKTPLAVYEYLYNNLNTEYYIGSRKGGIGTYEQKAGNDVDCSSLLIAMLRYLGYDADYVTGKVTITKAQLMELTATDTLENAEKIYMLLGKPLTRSNNNYILERTWVKTVIDGKEYQLDVNFKKFKPANGISEEIKAQNFDLDFKDYLTIDDADALFEQYKDQASLTDINLAGRLLENKKISQFPLTLPYDCNTIIEETHDIFDSSAITSDSITIVFGKYAQSINSARAYIDPISIQYVPCEDFYDTLGDVLDIEKPASIYAPISNDYVTASQKTICPALYLNNVKICEWSNARVSIGDKQEMTIATSTGGQQYRYIESRELIVGSIISIVIDTQTISPQALLTAYENYKKIKDTINENNFFESSYCDNYLNLIGNSYFAQLDIQNTMYASAYDVYKERELSFGLFNYEPIVETRSVGSYRTSTTLTKKGNFGLDILGVYNQALSLNGNADDVKSYLFASGYVSSYLESQTLQQFTGVKSVSTAEVFRQCNEKGIDLKMVSSENKNIIDTLQISAEDKAEITQKVDAGYLVIVPEKNITINQWTGTAYIVQSRDGTQNIFIITGDKNGGYSTMDIVAYMIIATIGTAVDMYGMIFGTVAIISAILATPLLGPAVSIAAAITVMVVFTKLFIMWIEDYQETVDLYFRALDGDEAAADRLNGKAFLATVSMFVDFATGGLSGSKGAGPDDVPTPGGRKTNLSNKGYADDVVDDVFKMKNVDSCSDELLESIAKSGKSADVAETLSKYSDEVIEALNKSTDKDTVVSLIAKHGDDAVQISAKSSPEALKAISGLSDDAAESFFKTAGKHGDELASAINKSANINDAVSFVSKYTDDGAEIFLRHGDDAIAAVKGCDAPYKAVEIIKNGGLKYGDQAVQALKKSGDKAIEALTKVPTKDCAELIARHGDDAATIFAKYGDEAVSAVKNCSSPKQAIKSINAVGEDAVKAINRVPTEECASAIYRFNGAAKVISDYGDDALQVIKKAEGVKSVDSAIAAIDKYGDDAIKAFKNATPTQECADYILKYGKDAADVFAEYGDDAVDALTHCASDQRNALIVISAYADDGMTALKNGITPSQISEIERIGITPNDFNKVDGKIRNLVVESYDDAQALIDSNRKIHSLFRDDELTALKNNVLDYENQYKADFKSHKIDGQATPAVAGVAYKNADGELEFFYGVNNAKGEVPDILDFAEEEIDSPLLRQIKKNYDEVDPSIYVGSHGKGSHAEVYAVCEALQRHPNASIDDFVVYVNYSKPTNQAATGQAFYTCPHCREILKNLNVLSNVEGF